ncbi:MAG: DEAD/DEAH box helicase [Burkholderiales bacterium]|nr:DEAD/DEAH box helicase [Burkholderiales bacterium]
MNRTHTPSRTAATGGTGRKAAKAASGKPGRRKPARRRAAGDEPQLSRQRPPPGLDADDSVAWAEWQRALRRQYGRRQPFTLRAIDADGPFGEHEVGNPETGRAYRVRIHAALPGANRCSCADFASNELGTCKHIEFALARLAARRGGKAALARGWQPPYSEVWLHHAGARSLRLRVGSDCPPELRSRAERLFDAEAGWVLPPARLAEQGGRDGFDTFVAAAAKAGHELRLDDDALAWLAQWRDARRRASVLAAAYPGGAADPALQRLLKTALYPYQAEGALFAARTGRALIGDEMGLGKTVQAIAAAELMARCFGVERVLVVCPTSLKHQWRHEFARFAGREVQVVQGLRSARQQLYRTETFCRVANYETLARDLDLIDAWGPELLIVDEAQRVKNWNTVAARAIRRIGAPYAVVLTGTPLENRLEELVAIVQLVDPQRLGPLWRLRQRHQQTDEHGRVVGYRALDQLGATLAPVMLRRRKAEVLAQLPARIDNTLYLPLAPRQRQHHDESGDIVARIVSRWRKTGFLSDADQRRLTCALQNMRMACNSSFLLDGQTDDGLKVGELETLLEEWFEQPEAKVVVFSQWLRTHELVARRLRAHGWGHVLFHGGVPSAQRGALVERFVGDPGCRVFLATDAGGVGLNLQHAAATVVNMDLPWNPAVLEQRIARVHRMGQKRPVQVVNLVAQAGIEEGMLGVLAFKQSLFAGVLDGGASEVFLQGTRLARFMKTVEEVSAAARAAGPAEAAPPAEAPAASEMAATPDAAGDDDEVVDAALARARAGAAVDAAAAAVATQATGQADATRPAARGAGTEPRTTTPEAAPPDPWAPLLDAALGLVRSLAAQPPGPAGPEGSSSPSGPASRWIRSDPESGQPVLQIPLPDAATVQRLAQGLEGLLAALRR